VKVMMAAMASAPGAAHGWPELDALYREHYRSLVRLASLLVDDVGTCEEIVQDAFVAVHRRGPLLRDESHAPAYLRSAVLNGARSHLRRRQVSRRHLAPVPDPAPAADHDAIASDEQRRVLAALRELPDRQRDVLTLRYYLDLSEAEIAETLGISPGSVKTHAHRGLAAMAKRLEER
jgi:RNA polymerase sigma-70 factor (sigma-E family)